MKTAKLLKELFESFDGELPPKECGVYAIVNVANKRAYIGSSKNMRTRVRQHMSSLRANKHSNTLLQNDFNTFKEPAFIFGALILCEPIARTYFEYELATQIIGPQCYGWSAAGQRSRITGHPALSECIYAPPEAHRSIKEAARKIVAAQQKKGQG